jgi:hypothetical protein
MAAYMRLPPKAFPPYFTDAERTRGLTEVAHRWLDAWLAMEAQIDPDWHADDRMRDFEPPKPVAVRIGVAPEAIADLEVRSAYEAWLAERRAFLERRRAQTLFRQARETRRESYLEYFAEIGPSLQPADDRLHKKMEQVQDPVLRTNLQALVAP